MKKVCAKIKKEIRRRVVWGRPVEFGPCPLIKGVQRAPMSLINTKTKRECGRNIPVASGAEPKVVCSRRERNRERELSIGLVMGYRRVLFEREWRKRDFLCDAADGEQESEARAREKERKEKGRKEEGGNSERRRTEATLVAAATPLARCMCEVRLGEAVEETDGGGGGKVAVTLQQAGCRGVVRKGDHLPEENEREIRQTVGARPPNSAISGSRRNALRRK
ncbi:hypothetical protein K440DRAFT_257846 [Wilcoxina mikolae CBS 423.85]|nr:hypothetical protein K440DRAFT_257846 [Wilcoxina mikolae CBS 423.85]